MDIRLDTRSIEPGGTLRGVVARVPEGGIRLAIRATVTTPFDEHTMEWAASDVADGPFELAGPTWPLTTDGPLIQTAWTLDVVAPNGATAASVPFDLVRGDPCGSGAITMEAVGDRTRPRSLAPVRIATKVGAVLAVVAAIVALVAGSIALFAGSIALAVGAAVLLGVGIARQSERDVHCEVVARPDRVECQVRLDHPHPPEVESVTASLVVVESAVWTRPMGGQAEHETVAVETLIDLTRDGDRTWHGEIVELPPPETPLSWVRSEGLEHWAVTWAVRFVFERRDAPDTVRIVHLRSHLSRLDPEIGGSELGDPRILRAH